MESNEQAFNFNQSYALLNQNILSIYQSHYPNLKDIYCENNYLIFKDQSFPLGYFRLNQLPVAICELSADTFFDLVKILADVENNLSDVDYTVMQVNAILEKKSLVQDEEHFINEFISKYLDLNLYENYLYGDSAIVLSKYRLVVNNILYLVNPINYTPAQKIIADTLIEHQKSEEGRSNSQKRILQAPGIPSTIDNEEAPLPKAGFTTAFIIIYIVINIGIILAINLLGK